MHNDGVLFSGTPSYIYKKVYYGIFMCKKIFKIIFFLLAVAAIIFFVTKGFSITDTEEEKLKDLDFTVLEERNIPTELMEVIEEKKTEAFNISYSDNENTYIVVGYGAQPTGGYSITVSEMYETENTIVIKTGFVGPSKTEEVSDTESYPYIVVMIEATDKAVVFKQP